MRLEFLAVIRAPLLALVVALATLLARPAAAQCPGDVIPSGAVNGTDLAELLAAWGSCPGCAADLSGNGVVDGADLAVLLGGWGPCTPVISGVMPNVGTIVGGTAVTIRGAYFNGTTAVTFGGSAATQVSVVDSTTITAVTPAAPAGLIGVTVMANGRVGTLSNAYSYSNSSITGVVPNVGSAQGGGAVMITGAYLADTSAVWFGDVPAQSFVQVSATQVNAVWPAGMVDTIVDVRLQTPAGLLVAPAAFSYVSIVTPGWATLVEAQPDLAVVTDPALRAAIIATGLAWRVRDTATGLELLLVPPGTFQMGCTMGSTLFGCYSREQPVHAVTLTNAFYLGRYEVTQAQWQATMGSNPSFFQGQPDSESRPVEQVSWNTALAYLNATGFRFPTEAEWEFACRAGTQTPYYNGSTDDSALESLAWFAPKAGETHAAGGKAANGFGFHDMLGNVWEWVSDWYGAYPSGAQTNPSGPAGSDARVGRGGSWGDGAGAVRSSYRHNLFPWGESTNVGFRVARTP